MNILHVASFIGNIGDNANHQGMRSQLASVFPGEHRYTELEIRKCYRIYTGDDRWRFDDDFAAQANQHELLIIGGGNFFEPWLTESSTGTTIDLTEQVLDQITVPVIFYGVGFDTYKTCPQLCIDRFRQFVEQLNNRDNVLVSFRNDGSYQNYQDTYGADAPEINVVPDGGFFYQPDAQINLPISRDAQYWGVNIASDMKEVRFPGGEDSISWETFLDGYAAFLSVNLERNENLQLIFFPHIYKDLEAIGELLARLDDRYCRDRIQVAPYVFGWEGAEKVFGLYRRCSLMMGMRFHTNVCALGMEIPAIALSSSPKLYDLYAEVRLTERVVKVNQENFTADLESLVRAFKEEPDKVAEENRMLKEQLTHDIRGFFERLRPILN